MKIINVKEAIIISSVVIIIFFIGMAIIIDIRENKPEPEGIYIELSYRGAYIDVSGKGVTINIDQRERLIFDNSIRFPVVSINDSVHLDKINEIVGNNVSRLIDSLGDYRHYLVLDNQYKIYHAFFNGDELSTFSYVTSMIDSDIINLIE